MYKYLTIAGAILALGATVIATSNKESRCFRYTWLGPRWNNQSVFLNATCQDATRLANGIPCELPLVVSYDGTWPDIGYIWTHHSNDASCILSDSDVCATYSYYFDGHPENSTHFCTRAVDTLGNAITSGCYEDRSGSFLTRVCFCRSVPGGVPCNKGVLSSVISLATIVFIVLLGINTNFINLWDVYI